jgi:hypothetical protein
MKQFLIGVAFSAIAWPIAIILAPFVLAMTVWEWLSLEKT